MDDSVGELSEFIRRKIRLLTFNVGLKCQLNWREFANYCSHDIVDSLWKIDRFAFDDIIDELYDVTFERPEEDRDLILPRLYHNLLDILLLNADKFSPSLAIHEFAKDLIFILEDFVRKEGPREVVEVEEPEEEVEHESPPYPSVLDDRNVQVKPDPEELPDPDHQTFESPESPPENILQSEINFSEKSDQDFQSPESPTELPTELADEVQNDHVSSQVIGSAEIVHQDFLSPESPIDDIPMNDVSSSVPESCERSKSPFNVDPSESSPIAEETEAKSGNQNCSNENVFLSPESPEGLANDDILMKDETLERSDVESDLKNQELTDASESIDNAPMNEEETVDSPPNSQVELQSDCLKSSEKVNEEAVETHAGGKNPDLKVLSESNEIEVGHGSNDIIDSVEEVKVGLGTIDQTTETDEVPKNDMLENQGNVEQKVISDQLSKNEMIENITQVSITKVTENQGNVKQVTENDELSMTEMTENIGQGSITKTTENQGIV